MDYVFQVVSLEQWILEQKSLPVMPGVGQHGAGFVPCQQALSAGVYEEEQEEPDEDWRMEEMREGR